MGAAHARAFAAEGGRVVIGDVLDDDGETLAKEIGDGARYHHLDVSSEGSWSEFTAFAEKAFGPFSVLVDNAGIGGGGPVETMTLEAWRRVLAVNLDGVFLGTRAAVASMRRGGSGGSIINISSWAGLAGTPFSTSYTASKFAVRGYTTGAEFSVDGGWAAGSPVSIGETHAQYGERA